MSATGERLEAPARFRGALLSSGDAGYDAARRIYNERLQGEPAAIAQCVVTQDVVDALALAREHGLEVSVRGGGHSIGGWPSNDGGLVIDLTSMRQVRIDPDARTAWIGGGTRAGDLLVEADRFGLVAVTGAASSIGVAGLTMGLGEAYLTPRLGYGADHLLAFELVTADGAVLRVTQADSDLFWALRGAGPNFGVVTALQVRLHPAPEQAVGGWIVFDGAHAEALTRRVLQLMEHASEYWWPMFIYRLGESSELEVRMLPGHTGSSDLAARELDALCDLFPPVADERRTGSYLDLVFQLPEVPGRREWELLRFPFGGDRGRQVTALLERLRPGADPGLTTDREILLWRSVAPPAPVLRSAAPRLMGTTIMLDANWRDAADDADQLAWVERTAAALRASGTVAEAGNAMNHVSQADDERVRGLYGPEAYERLAEIKARYDSRNVFRRNFNIPPAPPRGGGADV